MKDTDITKMIYFEQAKSVNDLPLTGKHDTVYVLTDGSDQRYVWKNNEYQLWIPIP